jgi:hypothetical protein
MYKYIQYNVYSGCKHYLNEGLTDDDIHDDDHGSNKTMKIYHDSMLKVVFISMMINLKCFSIK